MSDDLRSLLGAFRTSSVPPAADALWRRGRRRRARISVASIAVVAATAALASPLLLPNAVHLVRSPDGDSEGLRPSSPMKSFETGGYVFSNVEVHLAPQHDSTSNLERAVISGDVGWNSGFPGKRMCTWQVLDSAGAVIGSTVGEFTAAEPFSGVIKDRVDVSGEPRGIEIDCAAQRLDDPEGEFIFGDVTIEKSIRREPGGEREFIARATYSWEGTADPTPQTCIIKVQDARGDMLFEVQQGLLASDRASRVANFRFVAPDWASDDVAEANIDCDPIS